jgi:hypothetical protein
VASAVANKIGAGPTGIRFHPETYLVTSNDIAENDVYTIYGPVIRELERGAAELPATPKKLRRL